MASREDRLDALEERWRAKARERLGSRWLISRAIARAYIDCANDLARARAGK